MKSKSYTRILLLGTLLALQGCSSTAQSTTPNTAENSGTAATAGDPAAGRAAIEQALGSMHAAWDAHDMQAFGAAFSEDASFINIFGHRLLDRPTIIHHHAKLHERHFRDTRLIPQNTDIRLLSSDIAVAVVEWRLEGARNPVTDEPVAPTTGLMTATIRKQAGGWEIVALHNTRTMPIPGAPGQ